MGNFGAGQGLVAVVEAAAITRAARPDVYFVLAGDGPDRERVLARAAELGTPNLTVGPAIPEERTRAFYNACDVCLVPLAAYPILQETVPSKIFEVMACERPVLAALAGEGARIVRGADAGLVVPPGDPGALADAVLTLRDAPADERAAMGRRGRLHVAEHFSRDTLAARYLEILERAANPLPRGPCARRSAPHERRRRGGAGDGRLGLPAGRPVTRALLARGAGCAAWLAPAPRRWSPGWRRSRGGVHDRAGLAARWPAPTR